MTQETSHTASDIPAALSQLTALTPVEEQIITHPDWLQGAIWGKPRWGHPEGAVVHHILEVLGNVEQLRSYCGEEDYQRLRLITLVHDTFKYQVNPQLPRRGDNHHSRIAARFASRFVDDPGTLAVIRHHDDPYHFWLGWHPTQRSEAPQREKLDHFLDELGSHCQLFYWFYWCDNHTGNKEPKPFEWFESVAAPRIQIVPAPALPNN